MYKNALKMLLVNGWLFVMIGLYAVLFNNTEFFFIDAIMNPGFWGTEILSAGTIKFKTFAWMFMGMLHIVWGINIIFTVIYGLKKSFNAWAWNSIFLSVLVWLVIDIYYTFITRQNSFYIITLILAVLFIVPLVIIYIIQKKVKK